MRYLPATPLRLLYSRLLRYHLITLNPMEESKKPKISQQSTTIYLSRQEARQLEDVCQGPTLRDVRDHALIVLMLATGLRSSEVLGITFADLVEMDGQRVVWITGKGNQRDRVKLKPRTWTMLHHYLQALQAERLCPAHLGCRTDAKQPGRARQGREIRLGSRQRLGGSGLGGVISLVAPLGADHITHAHRRQARAIIEVLPHLFEIERPAGGGAGLLAGRAGGTTPRRVAGGRRDAR